MPELAQTWEKRTGRPLEQMLGTTELLHVFLAHPRGEDPPHVGSIGRPVPGYEVIIREMESFDPVPPGTQGILTVRGPTGTKYWKSPDKQNEAVRDGWNVIADIVQADDQGFVYFVARDDDLIMSGGLRIAPTQVEDALLRHPAVLECACVAARDPKGVRSCVVKAYIVVQNDADPSDELARELQDFVKQTAAPYLYPRIVEFAATLPRTHSGKIRRSELREVVPAKGDDS